MPLPRRFHTAWTNSGHRLRRRISEAEQPQTINLLATRRYFLKNISCRCRAEAMAATNNQMQTFYAALTLGGPRRRKTASAHKRFVEGDDEETFGSGNSLCSPVVGYTRIGDRIA